MKKTQRDRIRQVLLESENGITSWEAFMEFGITRLSAIIFDLRHKEGMNILSKSETRKNRYGDNTTFDRYILLPDNGQISLF